MHRITAFVFFFLSVAVGTAAFSAVVPAADDPFEVGEFPVSRVVDGDTIAVEGLEKTIRFLCIDTEECEKGPDAEERTKRIALDYDNWLGEKTAGNRMAKFSTPLGWKAREYAEAWFPIGSTVRVVYDSLSRKTGYYGRVLGYVFAQRNGKWVNYNVECVRAGMSPYFNKYGRSSRFEAEFLAAEREARIYRRGIWSPRALGYPNYDERCAWWNRRARAMDLFETNHGGDDGAVEIIDEEDWLRLGDLIGRKILLFGAFSLRDNGKAGILAELTHKEHDRAAVLFTGEETARKAKDFLARNTEAFVCFRGILKPGFKQGRRSYEYSLDVTDPSQVFVELPVQDDRPEGGQKEIGHLGADTISWKDAARYTGSEVSLSGTVILTKNIGERTFLNFDSDYRNTVTVVIEKENYGNFPEPAEKTYRNRTVLVRGTVTEHEGTPQIVITGPDQIDILE